MTTHTLRPDLGETCDGREWGEGEGSGCDSRIMVVGADGRHRAAIGRAVAGFSGSLLVGFGDCGALEAQLRHGRGVKLVIVCEGADGADAGAVRRCAGAGETVHTPVVILAQAGADFSAGEAYLAGVNSFLPEPADEEKLESLLAGVLRYWLKVNVPAKGD